MSAPLIDVNTIAKALLVKPCTIRRLVHGPKPIPHLRIGRRLAFDLEKVKTFLEQGGGRPGKGR